jgi:hypothetical protein
MMEIGKELLLIIIWWVVMLYFMDERFQREVQVFVAVQWVMKWQWIDSETYKELTTLCNYHWVILLLQIESPVGILVKNNRYTIKQIFPTVSAITVAFFIFKLIWILDELGLEL